MKALCLIAICSFGLLAGCTGTKASAGVGPLPGLLITKVTTPIGGGPAGVGPPISPKGLAEGRATFRGFSARIPLIPGSEALSVGWGDGSLSRALENGKLAAVTYADAKHLKILGIYSQVTIVAYGQPMQQ